MFRITLVNFTGFSINTAKQTDYVGPHIYENDVLQFINHEEGRIVMSGTKTIYSNSFNTVSADITGINTTPTPYSLNGENYVKATSTNATAGNGLFPIGGTFTVQPGDRYRIRFKGYRNGHAAYLQVKAGATVLSSPGTALPNSAATESWIEQLVTIPAGITTMQVGVVWGVVSLNEFMLFNELEIDQLTSSAPEYQYNLKDHLGNVRVTFTTAPTTKTFTAGFETANQTTEASNFSNYPTGAKISTVATNANSGSNSYYLNGGYAGQVGLTKSLSVMPGDVVSIQAYAKYSTPSTTATDFTPFVASLLAAFNLTAPAAGEVGTPASGVNYFGNYEFGSTGDENKNDAMKIFVTIIMYDRNYNFLDVAYQAVQGSGSSMTATYTAKQPGYAYLYISNEHPYLTDVYFDDVTVTFTPSMVVQQEDFYPFGLSFNSYSRENTVAQNFLYNSKEQINDLGLDWADYGARMYMPEIGRWGVVDPLAGLSRRWSPYTYAYDNPIRFVDVDGMYSSEFGADSEDNVNMKERANEFMQESQIGNEENAQTDNEGNTVHSSDIAASFSSNDYQFGADGTSGDDDPNPDTDGEADQNYPDVTEKFNKTVVGTTNYFSAQAKRFDALLTLPNADPISISAMKLKFFNDQVKTGAPFDIKQPGKGYSPAELGGNYATYYGKLLRYDDFGNYNYGVAAKAFGIPLEIALLGAGVNQIRKGNPDMSNSKGYFDHSQDTSMIINGYNHVYGK